MVSKLETCRKIVDEAPIRKLTRYSIRIFKRWIKKRP
jgi:hypothetical protein